MTNEHPTPLVLSIDCLGDAVACRKAYNAGRRVHMYLPFSYTQPTLVMPTYHFTSIEDGVAQINAWLATAPTVETVADLNRYRSARVAHFLPVGWVDPTRR